MLLAASIAVLATLQGVNANSLSTDVYTIRLTNTIATTWRPSVGEIELYSDTRCTQRINNVGINNADTVAISGSKFDSVYGTYASKGLQLAFDGSPNTYFRPNCHSCAAEEVKVDIYFNEYVPVACVKVVASGDLSSHAYKAGYNVYEKKLGSDEFSLLLTPNSPTASSATANIVNIDSTLLSPQAVLAARGEDWENWYGENCRGQYLPVFGAERASLEYCSCHAWGTSQTSNSKCSALVCTSKPAEIAGGSTGQQAKDQRIKGAQHCENR